MVRVRLAVLSEEMEDVLAAVLAEVEVVEHVAVSEPVDGEGGGVLEGDLLLLRAGEELSAELDGDSLGFWGDQVVYDDVFADFDLDVFERVGVVDSDVVRGDDLGLQLLHGADGDAVAVHEHLRVQDEAHGVP